MHYSCMNRFPEGWQWFWRGGLHWRVRERVEGAEEPLPQTTGQVLPQTAIQPAGPWRVAMATADVRGYRHSAASSQWSLVSGNGSSCSWNIQQNVWQCGIWVQMDTQLFFFLQVFKILLHLQLCIWCTSLEVIYFWNSQTNSTKILV